MLATYLPTYLEQEVSHYTKDSECKIYTYTHTYIHTYILKLTPLLYPPKPTPQKAARDGWMDMGACKQVLTR